jgi:hypothetical protein
MPIKPKAQRESSRRRKPKSSKSTSKISKEEQSRSSAVEESPPVEKEVESQNSHPETTSEEEYFMDELLRTHTLEQLCERWDIDGKCPHCNRRFYWSGAKHLKNGKHFCPKCKKQIFIHGVKRDDGSWETMEWRKK